MTYTGPTAFAAGTCLDCTSNCALRPSQSRYACGPSIGVPGAVARHAAVGFLVGQALNESDITVWGVFSPGSIRRHAKGSIKKRM